MRIGPDISTIAALIGDPARANILTALMGGYALTATELSAEAGVTKQTASAHLSKLVDAKLLLVEKQGRHKYYRIADHDIAELLEKLTNVAAKIAPSRTRLGPKEPALRKARRCYDHLAGDIAVELFEHFKDQKLINVTRDEDKNHVELTEIGAQYFSKFGIDIKKLENQKRPTCLACLDWSVRKPHLAGGLGAALLDEIESKGWAKRSQTNRIVEFTRHGEQQLKDRFGLK